MSLRGNFLKKQRKFSMKRMNLKCGWYILSSYYYLHIYVSYFWVHDVSIPFRPRTTETTPKTSTMNYNTSYSDILGSTAWIPSSLYNFLAKKVKQHSGPTSESPRWLSSTKQMTMIGWAHKTCCANFTAVLPWRIRMENFGGKSGKSITERTGSSYSLVAFLRSWARYQKTDRALRWHASEK
jgi:hypothetical protein